MSTSTEYKVLRAFRVPANGGVQVPYRIYEAGVALTSDDMAAWELPDEIDRLLRSEFIEPIAPPAPKE